MKVIGLKGEQIILDKKHNMKRLYAKSICRIISIMINIEMFLFKKMCQKLNLNDENKENFLFDVAFNGTDFDEFWENKMSFLQKTEELNYQQHKTEDQ